MKQEKFWLLVIISLFFLAGFSSFLSADSLWNKKNASLFSTTKPLHIGDILTIIISESSTAVQEAGTKTSKASNINSNLFSNWQQVAQVLGQSEMMRKNQDIKLGGGDSYSGTGQTSRKHKVEAIITAIVKEIYDNGTVLIAGEHNVKVNDEVETICISGIIRIEDVTSDNTIFSYQMAKADISVKGQGVVASKQTPGILTQLFNWLF